jgi:hypothetical protein
VSGPAVIAALLLAAAPPLTADGWGKLRIGMPEAEAARLFKLKVPPDDEVNGFACREIPAPDIDPGLSVMTQDGRVSRISLYEKSGLKTDRGFTVGSRERDIRRAYGPGLKVEPHHYEGEPAHYLTMWSPGRKRGVRYETDVHGVVTTIHAGDGSIQLVESCL